MVKYSGVLLGVSFAVLLVLITILLVTKQGDKPFGPLQFSMCLVTLVAIASSIMFVLSPRDRERANRGHH